MNGSNRSYKRLLSMCGMPPPHWGPSRCSSSFVHDPLIPLVHLLLQPVGEDVLQDRGDDIADPILADLVNLDCIRQIFEDVLVAFLQELGDLVQVQGVVLWDIAVPHLLLQDLYKARFGSGIKASTHTLLFATYEVFQELYCHLLEQHLKQQMLMQSDQMKLLNKPNLLLMLQLFFPIHH